MKCSTLKYGPWAVVTGASDGIGKAFSIELAQSGFSLVLVARRHELLEQLAQDLISRFGIECNVVSADLATQTGVDFVIQQTQALDVGLLIAAAGYGTSGAFVDAPIDEELVMIDLNCRAVVALTHHFVKCFKQRGRGGIVLMSSIVSFQGTAQAANYAATKAFIQAFAEGLRIELKPYHVDVDVLAVATGPIRSGFEKRANMQMGMAQNPEVVPKSALAALGQYTTVRLGWLSKVLGYSLGTAPRCGRVKIMSAIMGGMTKHKNAKE